MRLLALEMSTLDYEKTDALLRHVAKARALYACGRGLFTYARDSLVLQFVGYVAHLTFHKLESYLALPLRHNVGMEGPQKRIDRRGGRRMLAT